MAHDIFISYSRRDYCDEHKQVIPGNIVSKIKELFDANGITYWFDEDGVYSGDAFAPLIARNIKSAKIFLFISSKNSNASEWTSNEIATAHAYKKKIIPFKYDDSLYNDSVIIYIARLDYIECTANPDGSLKRLLASVQAYLRELKESEEKEHQEQQKREKEEALRRERAEKLASLSDEVKNSENRKYEIEKEILSHEKALTDLRNEKRILEVRISELHDEITALSGAHAPKCDAQQPQAKEIPQPAKRYKVGDYYNENGVEGVVFEVAADGLHGKIVSMDEFNINWCTIEQYYRAKLAGAMNSIDGLSNSQQIALQGIENYPAAKWCRSKGDNWYLPAVEELRLISFNRELINITLFQFGSTIINSKFHWSSTEEDNSNAWRVHMGRGGAHNCDKSHNGYIRAVSAF